MEECSSRKSSKRSVKSNVEETFDLTQRSSSIYEHRNQWNKRNITCNWNLTCKALFIGLVLMFLGGSMATIGYFMDHIKVSTDSTGNVTSREKSKLSIHNITTYVGPMIMGVGGFIVVAACVMTFEQRDNASKTAPTRLHVSTHHSIRANKPSPSSRPYREGSGRRHQTDLEDFSRRDLTADFIQFSRNLQQASIEKSLCQQAMVRSPSAPNLAALPDLVKTSSPQHSKHSRNSLHPLLGQTLLSPHVLQRQALSVDNPEYFPVSPKHHQRDTSTGKGSTSSGKGSAESLRKSSQASVTLDLHLNESPSAARIRDRTKRSDTARRHMLTRQAPIEADEDGPKLRRESISQRFQSMDDTKVKSKFNESSRGSSPTLQYKRGSYMRSNTICNEMDDRRGSSEVYRKSSAEFNYRCRRKSSNTSDSGRYGSKSNTNKRQNSKSPTSSVKSFQELRYSAQQLIRQESKNERIHLHRKDSRSKTPVRKPVQAKHQSLSPDSISISSSNTEGHSKAEFVSIDLELPDDDTQKK